MTNTEKRYAQIEKEALAITWACEKFAAYVLGLNILVETDHKPLVPLLGKKCLDTLPPRILQFRLRLMILIQHHPCTWKLALFSRRSAPSASDRNAVMELMVNNLPVSRGKQEHQQAQASDSLCSTVISHCQQRWLDKRNITPELRPYLKDRHELTIDKNGQLLHGKCIVVLQRYSLDKIHSGHSGHTEMSYASQHLSVLAQNFP